MDNLLTSSDAAEYLRVSVSTLKHWRRVGKGPAYYRFGTMVRYRKEDLENYVARAKNSPSVRLSESYTG